MFRMLIVELPSSSPHLLYPANVAFQQECSFLLIHTQIILFMLRQYIRPYTHRSLSLQYVYIFFFSSDEVSMVLKKIHKQEQLKWTLKCRLKEERLRKESVLVIQTWQSKKGQLYSIKKSQLISKELIIYLHRPTLFYLRCKGQMLILDLRQLFFISLRISTLFSSTSKQ